MMRSCAALVRSCARCCFLATVQGAGHCCEKSRVKLIGRNRQRSKLRDTLRSTLRARIRASRTRWRSILSRTFRGAPLTCRPWAPYHHRRYPHSSSQPTAIATSNTTISIKHQRLYRHRRRDKSPALHTHPLSARGRRVPRRCTWRRRRTGRRSCGCPYIMYYTGSFAVPTRCST